MNKIQVAKTVNEASFLARHTVSYLSSQINSAEIKGNGDEILLSLSLSACTYIVFICL